MDARYGLAVLAVLGLTVGCSENKLRAGYCEHDTDCASGQHCILEGAATFTCAASDGGLPDGDASEVAPECTTSSQCPAEKPICDAQTCRTCESARSSDGAACASRDSARPFCGPNGTCVECVSPTSADCTASPARPICDTTSNTCVRCASDDQCVAKGVAPGLCMSHQDGRCASDSEIIYVENKGGCASSALTPMAGSSGTPFCGPQIAFDALTPSRRVLVISGAVMGASWTPPSGATPVTIVGRSVAAIAPGTGVGIRVSGAAELYARDLIVRNSEQVGIIAEGGASLRLEHVTVDSNRGGGILVDSSAFDVKTSTITGNGPGQGAGGVVWGGIRIQTPGTPASLTSVTANNNQSAGVSCSDQINGVGVLATGNAGGVQVTSACGITPCSPAGPTCGAP